MAKKKPTDGINLSPLLEKRLSEADLEDLFLYILPCPAGFDQAVEHLKTKLFARAGEEAYVVLLTACQALAEQQDTKPGSKNFPSRLRKQLRQVEKDYNYNIH